MEPRRRGRCFYKRQVVQQGSGPVRCTPDVAFTYDAVGNRLTMTDGQGQETRTYDGLDRLLTVTRGQHTFAYVYDANGNITRRSYPGGTIADYAYDALDRLTSVSSAGQQTSYAYDAASNLVQTTLPSGNGYVETRVYDRAGRLVEVASTKGTSTLARFQLTLDPVGNPLQIVRTGALQQTQTYTYDPNDRLTQVCFQAGTCPGGADPFIRWSYDRVGNRLTEARPSATTSYSYDARDRLLSAGPTSYTYDANGNQLAAGSRTFAYDLANRLKTTTQGSTTTTYSYDGDGLRLQASTGAQASRKTNFLWDVSFGLPQLALERDGTGNPLHRYTYGVQRISMTSGNSTSYYLRDGLGSSANLTSSAGATQWTWSYEPFGSIRTETKAQGNQPDNPMRFTGEYADPTGLYHLRARQYDPQLGRFLSRDPAGQTVNESVLSAYVYVANRPTVLVDPSGEVFRFGDRAVLAAAATTDATARVPGKIDTRCRNDGTYIERHDDGRISFHLRVACSFFISQYAVWWAAVATEDGLEEFGRDTYTPNWGFRRIKWDDTLPHQFRPTRRFIHTGNFAAYPLWFRSLPFVGYWRLNVEIR